MQTVTQSAPVASVATVSPVELAVNSSLAAIASRDVHALHAAMGDLSIAIGSKPARADFLSKEGFKSAMDRWDVDKRQLARIFAAAEAAGFTVKETYSARGLASGSVSLAHRRAVTVKPSANKWKI